MTEAKQPTVDELEKREEELFRTGPLSVLTTSVKSNSQARMAREPVAATVCSLGSSAPPPPRSAAPFRLPALLYVSVSIVPVRLISGAYLARTVRYGALALCQRGEACKMLLRPPRCSWILVAPGFLCDPRLRRCSSTVGTTGSCWVA